MVRYRPGQVAEQTGFSLDTLRYYERIGLLDGIERDSGGRRVFDDNDLNWLRILRCLRDTGMPISRMVRYAELARGGDETIAERLALLEEHDRDINRKIELLLAEQDHIRAKISNYRRAMAGTAPELAPAREGA
ncbi:MerR family transcriptional regulator [Actinophytocola xinjiangensis]|uniref:MerR family transcriptional regulator n=1 Tax=Actinophytocola xinjiangensis TaxID=485602 RepID=A0A7Z1B0M7_9PSEU|nr:MerR family transcriptional regulator [Actinophytocola xinjiangensis]OLF13780.1 MerR family transcriptional regulator [Actinophytocola xinjiangensis]